MKKVRPRVTKNQSNQGKIPDDHTPEYNIQVKNNTQNIEIANKIIKYLGVDERF